MKFTKMQGCGNDFVIVDGPDELNSERVRELCDRRRGIGADGVLVVGAPRGRCWPVAIHNADGSLGESCGNGARCVARYLLDRHGGHELELSFRGGDVKARRDPTGIAITLRSPRPPQSIAVDGMSAYRVSLGNPHVVLFVADPSREDLTALAATAMSVDRMAERVTVRVPGGDLFVRPGPRVFELAGPAEYVFEGSTR